MDNQISPRTVRNVLKENYTEVLFGKCGVYAKPHPKLPFTIQRVNMTDSLTSTILPLPTKEWAFNVSY